MIGLSAMGWLRLVGSLKLQVSFAKEPYERDDILLWMCGYVCVREERGRKG